MRSGTRHSRWLCVADINPHRGVGTCGKNHEPHAPEQDNVELPFVTQTPRVVNRNFWWPESNVCYHIFSMVIHTHNADDKSQHSVSIQQSSIAEALVDLGLSTHRMSLLIFVPLRKRSSPTQHLVHLVIRDDYLPSGGSAIAIQYWDATNYLFCSIWISHVCHCEAVAKYGHFIGNLHHRPNVTRTHALPRHQSYEASRCDRLTTWRHKLSNMSASPQPPLNDLGWPHIPVSAYQ